MFPSMSDTRMSGASNKFSFSASSSSSRDREGDSVYTVARPFLRVCFCLVRPLPGSSMLPPLSTSRVPVSFPRDGEGGGNSASPLSEEDEYWMGVEVVLVMANEFFDCDVVPLPLDRPPRVVVVYP